MSVTPAKALCNPFKVLEPLFLQGCEDPQASHLISQHPDFSPTPLYNLTGLASKAGVANLMVKDESRRMGCNSFKPLGTFNCLAEILSGYSDTIDLKKLLDSTRKDKPKTFVTAGDPALARATAWAACFFGQKAEIFLPEATCPGEIEAIRSLNAQLHLTTGDFSSSLEEASRTVSEGKDKHLIQEHSWNGCDKPVRALVDGYYSLFLEIASQIQSQQLPFPDLVIIQSGSGLLLEAAARFFYFQNSGETPCLICVEPVKCPCMLESALSPFGKAARLENPQESIMKGLNYSSPARFSWPVIRSTFDLFLAIDDIWTFQAMKLLHEPAEGDPQINAGETGAAGLGGMLALMVDADLDKCKSCVTIDANSNILIINTEGVTNQDLFQKIMSNQICLD